MTTMSVDPQTAAFNTALEQKLAAVPPLRTLSPEGLKRRRVTGSGLTEPTLSELATDRTISGPAGELQLRVFVPETVRGVYLHLHGGGWVAGSARLQDSRLESLATACGVAVASVEYRLAPEHPYPSGPDDCEAAALWLVDRARSEFGADLLAIGGESAGAHLAVLTLLRLRDRHQLRSFRSATLSSGCFDLRLTPSARRWGERELGLTTPDLVWLVDRFLAGADPADASVSPLRADLTGLPAALFTVGTLDPLLDDSVRMAERWRVAGSQAELAVYAGGVHSFTSFPIPLADRANSRVHDFVSRNLGGPPS
jgi:acetyl esterase